MRAIGMLMILLVCSPAVLAQPQFRNAGAALTAESFTPANKVVQSGERVKVSLALKNVGDETASNLVAIIQSGNGVSTPDPLARNYGLLAPWGPSVAQEFEFTANAPTNSLLLVNLNLADSGRTLGTVTFRFRIGPQITSVTNSESIVINDLDVATPYPSVLSVSNATGSIINVSVTLSNLSHAFPDDLDILLVSPSGDTVMLMSDACGGVDLFNLTLTFSDDGTSLLPDFGLPDSPINRPTNHGIEDFLPAPAPPDPYAGVMSAFNGKTAIGDWKLFIWDDYRGDEGVLYGGWSLCITTLQPVDAGPTLTLLGRTTNKIRFAVGGRPGHSYAVESSPDPVQSFPLETFIMPASGVREFEYSLEPPNRFFRAATDP